MMPPRNVPYPTGKNSKGDKAYSFESNKNKEAWKGKSPRTVYYKDGSIGSESVATKSVPNKMTSGMGKNSGGRALFNGQGEAGMVENMRGRRARAADRKTAKGKKD